MIWKRTILINISEKDQLSLIINFIFIFINMNIDSFAHI